MLKRRQRKQTCSIWNVRTTHTHTHTHTQRPRAHGCVCVCASRFSAWTRNNISGVLLSYEV